jgi:hypothetical protein
MLRKLAHLVAVSAVAGVVLGAVALAAPAQANATTTASPATSLVQQVGPTYPQGGTGVVRPAWDWSDVLRVFTGMVECEALIPYYEAIYFPSIIACFPYEYGAVMVIQPFSWW